MSSITTDGNLLFHQSRIPAGVKNILLIILYSPAGLLFTVFRLFLGIHIFVISCLLPKTTYYRRVVLQFMLSLCGLTVEVEGIEKRSTECKMLVSNYRSAFDRLMLDVVHPSIHVNEWGLPPFVSWLLGLTEVQSPTGVRRTKEVFIQEVKKICQDSRISAYTRPEGTSTSGRRGLLEFSVWPFSVVDTVQPVTVTISRPVPVRTTTLDSNLVADVFWFLFVPYTIYKIRYLPCITRGEGRSSREFADQVQSAMADSLGIEATKYSKHDKNELIKRKAYEYHQAADSLNQNQNGGTTLPAALESMAQAAKQVVPQVPMDVIRREIEKTRDADAVLAALLEGTIQYTPEADPVQSRSATSSVQAKPPKSVYAMDHFPKKTAMRHLSLEERKKCMLDEARRKYISKHNLTITLEDFK